MSRGSRLVLLALLGGLFGLYTQVAQAFNVVVTGNTTPWDQTINPTFTFGSGVPDAPATVTNSDLFFTAGDALLIKVLSGSASAFPPNFRSSMPMGTWSRPAQIRMPTSVLSMIALDRAATASPASIWALIRPTSI